MGFPSDVVERALVACGRYCCLCHKFCGAKIETHHIMQPAEGGEDTFDNCIPLCFDCHAEVKAYDPHHPRGRKFTKAELKAHRDQWYQKVGNNKYPAEESDSISPVHSHTASLNQPQSVHRLALRYPAGIMAVVIVLIGPVLYYLHQNTQEKANSKAFHSSQTSTKQHLSKEVVLLVADFDGPEPKKYRVTEIILANLREILSPYPDVKIMALRQIITEKEGSPVIQKTGGKFNGNIAIWGWYSIVNQNVIISARFEILRPAALFPSEASNMRSYLAANSQFTSRVNLADLQNFTLQINIAKEMARLTLFTLGTIHYASQDWDKALSFFSKILKQPIGVERHLIYFYMGNIHIQKAEFNQAIANFSLAIKFAPGSAAPYFNRGNTYLSIGKLNQAITDFTSAIRLQPSQANYYLGRGAAYHLQRKFKQAIADFDQAIRINSNAPQGYYNKGVSCFGCSKFNRALVNFNKAIAVDPDFSFAYWMRGRVHVRERKYNQAIEDYSEALKHGSEMSPSYRSIVYRDRGNTHLFRKKFDRAILDFNQALLLYPNDPDTYFGRGLAYGWMNQFDQGVEDFTKAIKRQPNHAEAYYHRGACYAIKKNCPLAIEDFSRAIKLNPNFAGCYRARALVYLAIGNYDQARLDYEKFKNLGKSLVDRSGQAVDFYWNKTEGDENGGGVSVP